MQPYNDAKWKAFRDEVIRLDGGACVKCQRSSEDGVTLQVHHKIYLAGRKPWEYSYDCCETLCRGCHAEEHGKIPPRFGWEVFGWHDLEDLVGTCEFCGTAIRHVFLVQHEKWAALEVGEICCDNLTCTQIASDYLDSVRRFNERRKRFVSSPRWVIDRSGNPSITQKGIRVAIVRSRAGLRLQMNRRQGKIVFGSLFDAKVKAFDVIESGDVSKYLSKLASLDTQFM